MRHAPDALLICNQHKAVPVSEAIRRFEVVSVAFDVVRLAIAILVPQQCQMSRLLLRNNDIVVGKNQQSTRMLEANDKWCCGKALHHARRLPRIWDHQRSVDRTNYFDDGFNHAVSAGRAAVAAAWDTAAASALSSATPSPASSARRGASVVLVGTHSVSDNTRGLTKHRVIEAAENGFPPSFTIGGEGN